MSPKPPRAARRTNDPEGTRRRIVEAAFALFTTRGVHATAMHELREAAGVSGGALAHHFPSKSRLVLAVAREAARAAVEAAWIAPIRAAPTAPEGIAAAFRAIVEGVERRGAVLGCPLNNLVVELAAGEEPVRAALDSVFVEWEAALAAAFRADLDAGRARGLAPAAEAAAIVALYSGSVARAKAAQSAAPLRAALAGIEARLAPCYAPAA